MMFRITVVVFSFLLATQTAPSVAFSSAISIGRTEGRYRSTSLQLTKDNGDLNGSVLTFTSGVHQVFIEDTDAYGVVYNGNYLKFYERALQWFRSKEMSDRVASDNTVPLKNNDNIVNDDWVLARLDKQKFKASPGLGDSYVISGTRLEASAVHEVWKMEMSQPKNIADDIVYNTSIITIARDPTVLPIPTRFDDAVGESIGNDAMNRFVVHRDELEGLSGVLPLRSVLNYFERPRSNFFGGPSALRELQEEHNIIVVVTKIDQGSLLPCANQMRLGDEVEVQNRFVLKGRGKMCDVHQKLLMRSGELGDEKIVAQAVVTLLLLDRTTGKPATRRPEWLESRLRQSVIS